MLCAAIGCSSLYSALATVGVMYLFGLPRSLALHFVGFPVAAGIAVWTAVSWRKFEQDQKEWHQVQQAYLDSSPSAAKWYVWGQWAPLTGTAMIFAWPVLCRALGIANNYVLCVGMIVLLAVCFTPHWVFLAGARRYRNAIGKSGMP